MSMLNPARSAAPPTTTTRLRRRRLRAFSATSAVVAALALAVPPAFAAGPGFHELEGNIADDSAADPPFDWSDIFTAGTATAEPAVQGGLPATILDPDFTRDFRQTNGSYVNGDNSYFATGSKDTLDITPGWQCKSAQNATDKGDYVNAYGYAARVNHDGDDGTTPEHTVFFFGLEKDDDNGTNNVGIWLLQDENVGCSAAGGGNTSFTGSHENGDILAVVAYDSGGNVGTAQGYQWSNGLPGSPTFQQADAKCNAANIDYSKKFCIITNSAGTIDSPWWSPQKNDKSLTANLQKNVFVEGFLDLTEIFEDLNKPAPCFATSVANTRASTSTTAALYDFVEIEAATCGPLTMQKYFDRNADGTKQATEPFLQGWELKVFPDGAGPTGTPLYSGYTDANGSLSFADVPTGNYDVWETGKVKLGDGTIVDATEYWPSDPAGTTYPVKIDVTQTTAGTTIDFGNACFVDKTFTVTGVPAGVALELVYAINDADDNGPYTTVDLVASGTDRSYTLNNTLRSAGDTVDWTYQLDGDPGSRLPLVEDDESMAGFTDTSGIGTACAKTNTTSITLTTVSGTKYKDADGDGDPADADTGIGGFEFKLYAGNGGAVGTALQTTSSASDGTYSFSNLAPGTYSVVETPNSPAGWTKTYPATFHTVTVSLGQATGSIGKFLNAPLTDLLVEVDPQTNYTFADSIQCRKGGATVGTDVDGVLPGDAGVTKSVDANGLLVGTYVCTIVITDP